MADPRPSPSTPPASDGGDGDRAGAARAAVTHEVGPGADESSLSGASGADLSQAAGTSELHDPLLAAIAAAPTAPPRERELESGDRIGETFRIERRLGSGGMGVVYLARDESLDRSVAVKLHRAGAGVDRLQREAMAMARLSHPNVMTVHEVGRLGERVFVAMEFVPGGTLRAWLKARPRPWREALAVCLAAGDGLAAAHDAGLVHRDFKPENVLVGDDGRPRVGDFGLARAIGESSSDLGTAELHRSGLRTPVPLTPAPAPAPSSIAGAAVDAEAATVQFDADADADPRAPSSSPPLPAAASPPSPSRPRARTISSPDTGSTPDADRSRNGLLSDRLTMTGVLVGTPAYMAPEQFAGADVDARADQFAFAVMTWEALHGKRPFAGADQRVLRAAVEAGRIATPPRDSRVPARVRTVLARALAVSPDARWRSMHELLAALRAAARPTRRRLWIALAAAGVVTAAGLAWAAWPRAVPDPCRTWVASIDAIVTPAAVEHMIATVGAATGDRELLDRVRAQLERVRPTLHDAALASCRAARVERSMPAELEVRSQACLVMRAGASAILIDEPALATADPAAYMTRLLAVPSLGTCLDPVALAAAAPRNDATAIAARALLWAALADVSADRFVPALAAARQAVAQAAPDDRGARALAAMVEGTVAYEQDRLAEAATLLTDAYYVGVALDDTDVYLPALQRLVHLHGTDRFEAHEAEPWLRAGAAAIEKDRRRAAGDVSALLGALVGAADNRDDSAQAIAWAEQLLAMVPPGADSATRGEAELAMARALSGAGRYDEAVARYRGAIAEYVTALGPTHPTTAEVLSDFGLVLIDAGKDAEVPAIAARVRVALAAWPAARSTDRATALLNFGVLLTDRPADFPEAERAYREARASFATLLGPEHPDVALCDANLAVLENKRGNHAAAQVALERALAIQEKALGAGHYHVARTVYNIAAAAIMAGDFARAEPAAARAVAMFASLRPGSSMLSFATSRHARALSGLGHPAGALALAERAAQIADTAGDGAASISAEVEVARASLALGRDLAPARRYLDRARAEYAKFPSAYAYSLADVDALLAALDRR